MMGLFGKNRSKRRPIDPEGQRIAALTLDTGEGIFAQKGHSMILGGTGAGKSTSIGVPAIMSLIASKPEKAILCLDGKQGEFAIQLARMIDALGRKVAVIDDFGIWPVLAPYRISPNPIGSVVATYKRRAQDVIFALDSVTKSFIEEPGDGDAKNRYWRAWPGNIIEFGELALLKRNPDLTTPGGVAALITDPDLLRGFAETESEEGDAILRPRAQAIKDMMGHEHWPQHLEEAQRALKLYSPGTRLAEVGRNADITHEDLVREGYVTFLVGPQTRMLSLGPYYANHLLSFSNAVMDGAGPLRIIADEVTNCPVKPLLEQITIIRSFGGELTLIGQSLSEFERKFGKDLTRTLVDNCSTKQWLSFSDPEIAESLSKAIGDEHAVQSSLGSDSTTSKTQSNLSVTKQRIISASELMAMSPDEQLVHITGIGYFIAKKVRQNQIAPYGTRLIDENPLEGGKLPPDPKVTFVTPGGRS